MMRINSVITYVCMVLLLSCQSEGAPFLDHFAEKGSVKEENLYAKEISADDLQLLTSTNEVNEPIFNVGHKYYYGYKAKLDEDHYLVSFRNTYQPTYRFTHVLYNWADIYLCIYNKAENRVVSKLRISSSDPVLSFCKEEGREYIITSYYTKFDCADPDCHTIKMSAKNTDVSRYTITRNRFKKITNG